MKQVLILWGLLLSLLPAMSQAQWNEDWSVRNKINVNAQSMAGVSEAVAVPVRLHSGNFDFLNINVDGSDLRFIAGDDKTELKFYVEKFDALNELAVAWVLLPPGSAAGEAPHIWVYAGNENASSTSRAEGVVTAGTVAQFHFNQTGLLQDSSPTALQATGAITSQSAGLIGHAANFTGSPITIAANPAINFTNGMTWSAWVKPSALPQEATLFAMGDAMQLTINQQTLQFSMGEEVNVQGGNVLAATWQHVALAVGAGKATVYLNGAEVASSPITTTPEEPVDVVVGDVFTGEIDEMTISNKVLSPALIKLASSSQGVDSQLLTVAVGEEGEEEGDGEHNYMGILINSLTIDAEIVIGILAVMFLISAWVMWVKFVLVAKTDKDNKQFLARFQKATGKELLEIGRGVNAPNSTLLGLYQAGMREVKKREKEDGSLELSGASMDAIRAAVDADLVRETQSMNAMMVLLTIAISGGPFLGLLGTVVGVMITFAAIAAAGDVNVNAIAPGIAAALLATVAGLAVAIPALFGYNYLASRIKNITISMQIFVDEFITRIAELYGKE